MTSKTVARRYRLEDPLSATVMAEVFTATDVILDRRVVVKLLAPNADRPRFEREARAAAALGHPNIVQLFDYGEDDDRPFMVFEYLQGGSLEERLADRGRLADDQAAEVAEDLAAGLAHAHERGVVHRDLKPGNVLYDAEGRAKIADFGIALLGGADTITEAGTVLGTAAYISPEQAQGESATPASDIYSFGVVLYQILAGRLPFEAESPAELAALHREANPPPLASVRPDAPPRLAAIAMAALTKNPAERLPDGESLVAALARDEPGPLATSAETQIMRPSSPPQRRVLRAAAPVAAFSLVLLVAAGILVAVLVTNRNASAPAVPVKPPRTGQRSTTSRPAEPAASGSSVPVHSRTTVQKSAPSTRGRTTTASPSRSRTTTTSPPPATTEPTISETSTSEETTTVP
jgi:eukaryotic-like serine/threonine-protein kinase